MIYLSIFTILLVYFYLVKKHYNILKIILKSKNQIQNIYDKFNENYNFSSIYKLYFQVFLLVSIVLLMLYLLKLNYIYSISILIIIFMLLPLLISMKLSYLKDNIEFENLIIYLSQFVLVFKSDPKVLYVLNELKDAVNGPLQHLIGEVIEDIENGISNSTALLKLSQQYPHFIVYNLHNLVVNIEMYGSNDYYEALDLIADDVDDWLDDINNFNYEKNLIINKVGILIIFSFVICFMALNMLFNLEINTNTILYQSAIFLFIVLEILTYILAHTTLLKTYLNESECL